MSSVKRVCCDLCAAISEISVDRHIPDGWQVVEVRYLGVARQHFDVCEACYEKRKLAEAPAAPRNIFLRWWNKGSVGASS